MSVTRKGRPTRLGEALAGYLKTAGLAERIGQAVRLNLGESQPFHQAFEKTRQPAVMPSSSEIEFSAPIMVFRSSIARPTDTPIYASTSTSRCSLQDSGPRWIRFSFLVGLFHSQQHAGLSRRTSENPV